MIKRIAYRGHYYYYVWSFHSKIEAERRVKRAQALGYKTRVLKLPGRLNLYGLYTSPEYSTYKHKMSDIVD